MNDPGDLLHATRVALALAMLAGAALLDVRTRRVPNGYWFPFVVAAAALLAVDAGTHGAEALAFPLAAAAIVAAFAYLVWRLRLFGGADAKALMLLAFLVPDLPAAGTFGVPFALDVLMNGTLLSALVPFALLAWNLAHGHLRLPAAFIGFPMPLDKARRSHVWPMQRVADDGHVTFRYWTRIGMDADAAFDRLAAAGRTTVWVTAKVPLVALMAVGGIVALAWGNLLLRLAVLLVGG